MKKKRVCKNTRKIPFGVVFGFDEPDEPREVSYYDFLYRLTFIGSHLEYKSVQNVSCDEETLKRLSESMSQHVKLVKSVNKGAKLQGKIGPWRVIVDNNVPFQHLKLNLRKEVIPDDDLFEHGDRESDHQYY